MRHLIACCRYSICRSRDSCSPRLRLEQSPTICSRSAGKSALNPTFISPSSVSRGYVTQAFSPSAHDATIYALSTAPGRAAIAIIRCSGAQCLNIYKGLCPDSQSPKPRLATVKRLMQPGSQVWAEAVLDSQAVVLYFPGPNTATGEDVLEFHVHGGPAIVKAVLAAIPSIIPQEGGTPTSIRYAEPGEFTRRAFHNNRLDLTQVEALGDTLSAETEQQRRLAVRGMSNTLNERYERWRQQLLYARGELEALIDFSEDQHFDESAEDFVKSISEQIQNLAMQIHKTTRNAAKGELLRHGIKIALLGAPNAGKSSLLNQIVGREAAIVSSEAGTTRDVIEVNVDIRGYFCRFNDLAGVRSQKEGLSVISNVEREGITRAKAHARQADVVVVVIPIEEALDDPRGYKILFSPEIMDFIKEEVQAHQKVLFVLNKSDLADQDLKALVSDATRTFSRHVGKAVNVFPVSCLQAATERKDSGPDAGNLQVFLDGLSEVLSTLTSAEQIEGGGGSKIESFDESLGTTHRQRTLLERCALELETFLQDVNPGHNLEGDSMQSDQVDVVLAAERLRCAADCLAKITGRGEAGDVEHVLGVVFEKFCVGK